MDTFTPTPLKKILDVKSVITIHDFNYAPDFLFTGERHDFWEAAYVARGNVGVVADSNGYTLSRGEMIFHRPNEYHNIWANGESARVVIISFTSCSEAMSFFESKIVVLNSQEHELVERIINCGRQLFSEPMDILYQTSQKKLESAPVGTEQLLAAYIEEMLIRIMQSCSEIDKSERSSQVAKLRNRELIVGAIIAFLNSNINRALTLDDICGNICFSKTYIKNLFKGQTGYSIIDYFTFLKIERAKLLLAESDSTITEISDLLGFNSVHYFSRVFKARCGVSPSAYRK